MRKQKIGLFVFLFVASIHSALFSQIGASKYSGCAPLQVDFTAPTGSSSWNWNFGNGTSQAQNPSNVFNQPGVYNVSYSGSGGSPSSGIISITVTANNINPSFSFNVPQSKCAPMTVGFNGTTNSGTVFQWAFGDGGLGNGASLNYVFTIGGIFNPTLSVTDPISGCTGTASNGPINVSTLPNLIIDANPGLNSCISPFTTAFTGTNSSSGSPFGGSLTYTWSFGNAQTSNQPSPGSITYNNQGYYNVTLSATDNNNCSNSTTVVVSVIQPTLSATVPASICIYAQDPTPTRTFAVSFQSSVPNVVWDMDDGNVFSMPTSVGTFTYLDYNTPGLKTLSITASIGNCVASVTKTIFVELITPQFTFTPASFTCSPTMLATYINQSSVNCGATLTYGWKVQGWGASVYSATGPSPTFTLQQASLNPYTYYGVYHAEAEEIVTSSPLGCLATISHVFDSIRRPTAWFNKSTKQGCVPLTVKFRDSSNTNTAIYPIQSYTWNNGANPATLISGTIPPAMNQPTFTYSTAGTYTPFLIINTAGGCIDTSFVDTIIVVNTPTIVSNIPSNLFVCAGQPVQINMSALPSSTVIQHWHAESDDGFFSGCVTDSNPTWVFTHLGPHNFTLSAYDHGCETSLVPSQTVTVKGPLAVCRYRTNCGAATKKTVDFISDLQQVQVATLDFGDNSPAVTIVGNPTGEVSNLATHAYTATGDYTATITGSNSATGCAPYTFTMLVTVREITASFNVPPYICSGGQVIFDASASKDVLRGCSRGYAWLIDDSLGTRQTDSAGLYHSFIAPGIHTITLVVKDANSCLDALTKTFVVDNPLPSFSFAANPACPSDLPLHIYNTTPQQPVPPSSYTWSFGASASSTLFTTSDSTIAFPYSPASPSQTYIVNLTAVSGLYGCISSYSTVLEIGNPPPAFLYPFTPAACVNQSVLFNVDSYTNTLNFQDGSPPQVFVSSPIAHTYTTAGNYFPVVSFSDALGCISSFTSNVDVQDYPQSSFLFYPTSSPTSTGNAFCAPVSITFSSTAVSSGSLNYSWNLGTGSPIVNSSTVGTIYTSPGVVTVTLTVSTSNSCSATMISTLSILGPTATAVIQKASFCLGETIKLSIKDSSDILGWNWYFGDGTSTDTLFANSQPTATITYPYSYFPPPNGSAVINLVYFSSGHLCPRTSTVGILVNKVDADFKRNAEAAVADSVHCLAVADQFSNTSLHNNSTYITGMSFNWKFGDGDSSTSQSPNYTYPVPGVYTVTLTVTDPLIGCKDMTVRNMTINPLPSGKILAPDSICKGSSFMLSSSSSSDASTFQWQPASGLTTPNQATTTAVALLSTTYSLTIGNVFGCQAFSNSEYVYIQPPAIQVRWDTTIVIGQTATINGNLGSNFTYTWFPLTDLSCEYCTSPVTTTTVNATYSVSVEDNLRCFTVINTYSVIVDPLTTLDVPTAFTPNGDGVNDVIYVAGWGIRKLNFFRIFNRWGEMLFESTDIKVGWDGTYKGVPQNMETYVYQVSADGYVKDVTLNKTSSFRLIR